MAFIGSLFGYGGRSSFSSIQLTDIDGSGIAVNGRNYQGKNIRVENNKVYVDGVLQPDTPPNEEDERKLEITVFGDVRGGISLKQSGVFARNSVVIDARDIHGPVTTGSGDVFAQRDIIGAISTGSGDIDIKGDVNAPKIFTGSGDVKIEGNCTPVSIKTGSGDVTLYKTDANRSVVSTGSGDVRVKPARTSSETEFKVPYPKKMKKDE
jgi:hypothetical protein